MSRYKWAFVNIGEIELEVCIDTLTNELDEVHVYSDANIRDLLPDNLLNTLERQAKDQINADAGYGFNETDADDARTILKINDPVRKAA